MRLARLDLTRYGKFTGAALDFGPPPAGTPDLHVVYGPNEAGKSTAFSAWLDLVYGFEARSRYAFLHPYPSLRIGGRIGFADGESEFIRLKRNQNSLLDAREQPLADATILRELGGIDRAAYATMFSLDDDTLEAGGDSILESRGDLGQLLFSASAGLADLSHALAALREEADGFYRFRARSGALADLKARLAELRTERDQIDVAAAQYAALTRARDQAKAAYTAAQAARGEAAARAEQLRQRLAALPRLRKLADLTEAIARLGALPPTPPDAATELPALRRDETELDTREELARTALADIDLRLAALAPDAPALAAVPERDALADLRARHVTALKDLPERRLQLRDADLALVALLARLGQPDGTDPRHLLVDAPRTGRIRALIETRAALDLALRTATAEVTAADARLAALDGDAAPDAPPLDDDARDSLQRALDAARSSDHGERRRAAARRRGEAQLRLSARSADLGPGAPDRAGLAALVPPPPSALARWKTALAAAEADIAAQTAEALRLEAETRRLAAEIDAERRSAGLVSDSEAVALREARDRAWSLHRAELTADSAAAFETALVAADRAADRRLAAASLAERLTQRDARRAGLQAEAATARGRADAARKAADAVLAEVAAVLAPLGEPAPAALRPDALELWLDARRACLDLMTEIDLADADRAAADADETRLAATLATLLDAAGDLETLTALARRRLDAQRDRQSLDKARAERRRERDERRTAVTQAEADLARWQADWSRALAGSWLAHGPADPDAIRETLAVLADLAPLIDRRDSLADRIAKMEKDSAAFAAALSALAARLGIDAPDDIAILDIATLDRTILSRIDTAVETDRTRASLLADRTVAADRLAEIAAARALHVARRERFASHFGVATLADIEIRAAEADSRDRLTAEAAALEADVLADLGLARLVDAEALLEGVDRDMLAADLLAARADFDALDARARELFSEASKAEDRLAGIGGDGRVAGIEAERRVLLMEIEERATAWLKLRAGTLATEQALRLFRDRHRSSMLERASDAFRTVSRGAYAGLAAQPGKDGDVLIAVTASGSSKAADELSKGTRFQLYLALRVAGYMEFSRRRAPVPFIADDIMETFDDFRAEEAFRLFGDMAGVGQVIYLTHHRHLCDIAARVCPGARIHEIPA